MEYYPHYWAEGVEGKNPMVFVEVPSACCPALPLLHCVKRSPNATTAWPAGSPPSHILQHLNFRDQDEILQAARAAGELIYQNSCPMWFLDYSTQKLQRCFDSVKAVLRAKGIKYSILFSAQLRVVDGETVHP